MRVRDPALTTTRSNSIRDEAAAERRGRTLITHADLWSLIIEVHGESPGLGLRRLFAVADHIHSNFNEDGLPIEAVEGFTEDIKELLAKLEDL